MAEEKYPPFSLDLIKPGYGLLTRHEGGFFSRGIEKKQRKEGFSEEDAAYTHIEVLGPPPWSICVAPPKTRLVDITKKYKGRYVKIVRYKRFENDRKLSDVAFWAATHCNVPYDWSGVISFSSIVKILFVWIKQHASKWFCSENFCWSHQQVYFGAFAGMEPSKYMPADGLDLRYIEEIWEGVIE